MGESVIDRIHRTTGLMKTGEEKNRVESFGLVKLLELENEIERIHSDVVQLNRTAGSDNRLERESVLTRELELHKARVAFMGGMGKRVKVHDSFRELETYRKKPFVPKPPTSH